MLTGSQVYVAVGVLLAACGDFAQVDVAFDDGRFVVWRAIKGGDANGANKSKKRKNDAIEEQDSKVKKAKKEKKEKKEKKSKMEKISI